MEDKAELIGFFLIFANEKPLEINKIINNKINKPTIPIKKP